MLKTFAPILAATMVVGTIVVAQAQPVAVESFSSVASLSNGNTTANPIALPGNPDLGTGFQYDSSFEFLPLTLNTTDAFPGKDNQSITVRENTDHFVRVFNAADPIPNTTTSIQFAIAVRVDGVSADPLRNNADVIRTIDSAGAGGGGNIVAIIFEDSNLRFATNGTANVTILTNAANVWNDSSWRVIAGIFNRSNTGNGTIRTWVLNQATGITTDLVNATGLTNTNLNPIHTLAFGATFDEPPAAATADFAIRIDEIAFFNEANEADFLTAVRNHYNIAASVTDWTTF